MNLVLSTTSIEYANAVSHELWMLARPREYSAGETSQYFCGTFAHPDGTKVAIGPIDGKQNVHLNADEIAFVDIVRAAITEAEALALAEYINEQSFTCGCHLLGSHGQMTINAAMIGLSWAWLSGLSELCLIIYIGSCLGQRPTSITIR